jgi:hypothetical protein
MVVNQRENLNHNAIILCNFICKPSRLLAQVLKGIRSICNVNFVDAKSPDELCYFVNSEIGE